MTVTEFATLKLVYPHVWGSPEIQAFFATLSTQQGAWSGYPLRFFEDTTDPRLIYLITGWEGVAAHYEWIRSEQNQQLLERSKGLLEVEGVAHAELDSEGGDAKFVVWKQWSLQEGESLTSHQGVGLVVDQEGPLVYSLQGYTSEEDAKIGLGVSEDGRNTICARRLTVDV
ncbi:hypothetical protein BD309DRAFT_945799, partial [Dichomitus squalens]